MILITGILPKLDEIEKEKSFSSRERPEHVAHHCAGGDEYKKLLVIGLEPSVVYISMVWLEYLMSLPTVARTLTGWLREFERCRWW